MITKELSDYIKAQRGFNVAKEPIVEALLSVGWQRVDIDEAFALLEADPKRAPAGMLASPDFLGDGVTIFEDKDGEKTEDRRQKTGTEDIKVRFPEGLTIMPKPADNAFAKEGGIPMRPAEGAGGGKEGKALKGLLYATFVLIALAVAVGTVYILNPSLLEALIPKA